MGGGWWWWYERIIVTLRLRLRCFLLSLNLFWSRLSRSCQYLEIFTKLKCSQLACLSGQWSPLHRDDRLSRQELPEEGDGADTEEARTSQLRLCGQQAGLEQQETRLVPVNCGPAGALLHPNIRNICQHSQTNSFHQKYLLHRERKLWQKLNICPSKLSEEFFPSHQ